MVETPNRRSVIKKMGTGAILTLAGVSATKPVSAYTFDEEKMGYDERAIGEAALHHASHLEWDASLENGEYIHRFRLTGVGVSTDNYNDGEFTSAVGGIEFIPTSDEMNMINDGMAPSTTETDVSFSPNTASIFKAKEKMEDETTITTDYDMYRNDMEYSYGQEDTRWDYSGEQKEMCYQLRFDVPASVNSDYSLSVELESTISMLGTIRNVFHIESNGTDLSVSYSSSGH